MTLRNFSLRSLLLVILMMGWQQANAILVGKNIDQTIIMLNTELDDFTHQVDSINKILISQRARYHKELSEYEHALQSVQISLLSQQEKYIFGKNYVSAQATQICKRFQKHHTPIIFWASFYDSAILRYETLQKKLGEINSTMLSETGKQRKTECEKLLSSMLDHLKGWRKAIDNDKKYYEKVKNEVSELQTIVDGEYKTLHKRIFFTPGIPYTRVLKNWESFWPQVKDNFKSICTTRFYGLDFGNEWSKEALVLFIISVLVFLLGTQVGYFFLQRWVAKRWAFAIKSKFAFSMMSGWAMTTIVLLILRFLILENPFFKSMATLGAEFCLLSTVMVASVMLRVRVGLFLRTLAIYTPTFIITAIVIAYRAFLVTSGVIYVTFFPILLFTTLLQLALYLYLPKHIMPFDRTVEMVSLIIYGFCCYIVFIGYHMQGMQIVMLWTILLTGILILSCFFEYIKRCERYRYRENKQAYLQSWRPFTFSRLYRPLAFIIVFGICIFEYAHIFNIDEWLIEKVSTSFIDKPNVINLSVTRIFGIALGAIILNYLLGLLRYLLHKKYGDNAELGGIGLSHKVLSLLAWGIFIIISLAVVEVNSMGLIAALGGLTVGLGIALRDTFDCFLCGITLMMGRLKIGDIVECDGNIRGKVLDIQYRTTLIETDEGAIISVFNTSFFNTSFRNVSKSGQYERMNLAFRIQKECNVPKVRDMLVNALKERVPSLAKNPEPIILFSTTNRFFIELIAQVWIPIDDYYVAISQVKETIYLTLIENGMSNMSVDSRIRVVKLEDERKTIEEES